MKELSDKNNQTIKILFENNIIPSSGNFQITEKVLFWFIKTYRSLSMKSENYKNGKFDTTEARTLAGLTLLNFKRLQKIKTSEIDEGIVYFVTNPAWKDYTKIGITINLESRLLTYQTSDPHRAYKCVHREFCIDKRRVEKQLLISYQLDLSKTEWVKDLERGQVIKTVRNSIEYYLPDRLVTPWIKHSDVFWARWVLGHPFHFFPEENSYRWKSKEKIKVNFNDCPVDKYINRIILKDESYNLRA